MRGCPYFREQVGTSWSPFPLMRRVEGCVSIIEMEDVAGAIWEERWALEGGGQRKSWGPLEIGVSSN